MSPEGAQLCTVAKMMGAASRISTLYIIFALLG